MNVTPLKPLLAEHKTIPTEVRSKAEHLQSEMARICRVLNKPAAMPDMLADAKARLIPLAQDALALWSEI